MNLITTQQLIEEASDSIYNVIEEMNDLHRLYNSGILLERDMSGAMDQLESRAQTGMKKIDEAISTVKNYQVVFKNNAKDGNVFEILIQTS